MIDVIANHHKTRVSSSLPDLTKITITEQVIESSLQAVSASYLPFPLLTGAQTATTMHADAANGAISSVDAADRHSAVSLENQAELPVTTHEFILLNVLPQPEQQPKVIDNIFEKAIPEDIITNDPDSPLRLSGIEKLNSYEIKKLDNYSSYIRHFLQSEKDYFSTSHSIKKALNEGRAVIRTLLPDANESNNSIRTKHSYGGNIGISPFLAKGNLENRDAKRKAGIFPISGRLITGNNRMFVHKYPDRIAIIVPIPKQDDMIKFHEMCDFFKVNKDNKSEEFRIFYNLLKEMKDTTTRPDMLAEDDMATVLRKNQNKSKLKIQPLKNNLTRQIARRNAIYYESFSKRFAPDYNYNPDKPHESNSMWNNEMTIDLRSGYPIWICSIDGKEKIRDNYLKKIINNFPDIKFFKGNITTAQMFDEINNDPEARILSDIDIITEEESYEKVFKSGKPIVTQAY